MSGFYTFEELLVLARPIALDPTEFACDRTGCDRWARWLLRGAVICQTCWTQLLADHVPEDGVFELPLYELDVNGDPVELFTGDERWRAARVEEYGERLRRLAPEPRTDEHDRSLERLLESRVDLLLAEALA